MTLSRIPPNTPCGAHALPNQRRRFHGRWPSGAASTASSLSCTTQRVAHPHSPSLPSPLALTKLKRVFHIDPDERVARAHKQPRQGAGNAGERGGNENDITESRAARRTATPYTPSGNESGKLLLPILAAFAAHNTKCQVAASHKPPSIPPPCRIAIRHKIEKRQKRQCSPHQSTLPSTIHFVCSVTPLLARRGAGGEDSPRPRKLIWLARERN
jgi:hypothetical protein